MELRETKILSRNPWFLPLILIMRTKLQYRLRSKGHGFFIIIVIIFFIF